MEDSLDDFIKKYRNTFVFLKYKESDLLVEFVDSDRNLIFHSPEVGQIVVRLENARKEIKCLFPKNGIYNVGSIGFSEFIRIPERQWKRSPCKSNCAIVNVAEPLIAQTRINYESVSDCFTPQYPATKLEAEQQVQKRGGVALNDKFGITLGDNSDYVLYYGLNAIGTISDSKIDVQFPPLIIEVTDYFGKDLVWKT